MPSGRPSVFYQRERADGGPFLIIEQNEEDEGFSVDVIFTDTPPAERIGDYRCERILNVSPDLLRIYPLKVQPDRVDYLKPRYGTLTTIALNRRIDRPYPIPTTTEEVEELLEMLPDGFAKDFRLGLGLLWEYRSICEALEAHGHIELLIVHGGHQTTDATLDGPIFVLGLRRFHDMRKEINRITSRYQRDARRDKQLHAYHELLHAADPRKFPRQGKTLRADAIADATSGGRDRVTLSKRDRRATVGLLRSNLEALAASDPDVLLSLKTDIEEVSLDQLILRFSEMLGKALPEARWQSFLTQNPFILSLAFAVPALLVEEQAYAGGKRLNGRGGAVADFLLASASTGNLAIVEIKRPTTELLGAKPYRQDVYAASGELSGTMAQVLDQRVKLQRQLPALKDESNRPDIQDYGIRCIIVAGRTPEAGPQRRSFELIRSTMNGVTVVTFDELLGRLREIRAALGAKIEGRALLPGSAPWRGS